MDWPSLCIMVTCMLVHKRAVGGAANIPVVGTPNPESLGQGIVSHFDVHEDISKHILFTTMNNVTLWQEKRTIDLNLECCMKRTKFLTTCYQGDWKMDEGEQYLFGRKHAHLFMLQQSSYPMPQWRLYVLHLSENSVRFCIIWINVTIGTHTELTNLTFPTKSTPVWSRKWGLTPWHHLWGKKDSLDTCAAAMLYF